VGDTLFGHLCWVIRQRKGEQRLTELLDGYCAGRPFAVLSDAFPAGFLPRPTIPDFVLRQEVPAEMRKAQRKLAWLPSAEQGLPLTDWLTQATNNQLWDQDLVTQNTIHRLTGTTGTGVFAPRRVTRLTRHCDDPVEIYAAIDAERFSSSELAQLLDDIGAAGYGRDATTGLGKFSLETFVEQRWGLHQRRHAMTLSPCAPVAALLHAQQCFYKPVPRFGRHGGMAAVQGNPFKRPVLLAQTGALLTLVEPMVDSFHGRGLGGQQQPISTLVPQTVHQGYAPMVPLNIELST
jgi:CRISPR-associated protein Csm4